MQRRAATAAAGGADGGSRALHGAVLVLAVGFLLGACAWKAWVTDDAYITFRAVENLVQGRGPTWNVGERVQVFTHPLWMLAMAALRSLSGEYFYSSILLGLGMTLAAVILAIRGLAPPLPMACMGIAILVASRAFTDFSTSGLENALTHLCLAALFVLDCRGGRRFVHHLGVFLAGSACLLCRMDTAFLILPVLGFYLLRHRDRAALLAAGLGVLPFVGWEVFSVFYYGFFLPNSAVAKLNSGLGGMTLAAQGVWYLLNSLRSDFVTLAAALGGAVLALRSGERRQWVWGLGVILALLYVVHVGGDFMSGRFLTAPLWVGTLLLLRARLRPRHAWAVAGACGVLVAIPYFSPFVDRDYGRTWYAPLDARGIADERLVYDEAALRRILGKRGVPRARERAVARLLNERWPEDPIVEQVRALVMDPRDAWPPASPLQPSGAPYRRVVLRGAVGYLGFYIGPQAHVLDYNGIGDPLLARLPALVPDPVLAAFVPPLAGRGWRIGHFTRAIPSGYAQTLATGQNQIRDPSLARYYDKLALITRGRLFDGERLRTIWRFQRGEYDRLLRGE